MKNCFKCLKRFLVGFLLTEADNIRWILFAPEDWSAILRQPMKPRELYSSNLKVSVISESIFGVGFCLLFSANCQPKSDFLTFIWYFITKIYVKSFGMKRSIEIILLNEHCFYFFKKYIFV